MARFMDESTDTLHGVPFTAPLSIASLLTNSKLASGSPRGLLPFARRMNSVSVELPITLIPVVPLSEPVLVLAWSGVISSSSYQHRISRRFPMTEMSNDLDLTVITTDSTRESGSNMTTCPVIAAREIWAGIPVRFIRGHFAETAGHATCSSTSRLQRFRHRINMTQLRLHSSGFKGGTA